MMNIDKELLLTELEDQKEGLFNSKNTEDERAAMAYVRLIADIKKGKYDVKVWED
jgi:hypothetical protein